MRHLRPIAAIVLMATLPACFHELPPAPTKGYGAPYTGTGKPIYVKDSRTDWGIKEGGQPVTSEQALEAVKDEEYEIRRQDAKKYNDQIHEEGEKHRSLGKTFLYTGIGIGVAGFAVMAILPTALRESTTTPANANDPEEKVTKPGGASNIALVSGLLVGAFGVAMAVYGYIGGSKDPPYQAWKTPKALDRPAYVREKTEKYNEDIGAPAVEDQPGSVESLAPAPGQRKPPPERPQGKTTGKAAFPSGLGPGSSATLLAPTAPGVKPATSATPGRGPAPPASSANPNMPQRPVRPGVGR